MPGTFVLQLIVDDDVAAVVGGNPSPVESQVVRVGSPSHGQKDVSAYDFWRTVLACEAPRRHRDRAWRARYISHSAGSARPQPPRMSRTAWETSSSSRPIRRGPISTIVTLLPE